MGSNDPQEKKACTLRFHSQPQTLLGVHLQHMGILGKKITKNLDTLNTIHLGVLKSENYFFFPKNEHFFQLQVEFSPSTSTLTGEMV